MVVLVDGERRGVGDGDVRAGEAVAAAGRARVGSDYMIAPSLMRRVSIVVVTLMILVAAAAVAGLPGFLVAVFFCAAAFWGMRRGRPHNVKKTAPRRSEGPSLTRRG